MFQSNWTGTINKNRHVYSYKSSPWSHVKKNIYFEGEGVAHLEPTQTLNINGL